MINYLKNKLTFGFRFRFDFQTQNPYPLKIINLHGLISVGKGFEIEIYLVNLYFLIINLRNKSV